MEINTTVEISDANRAVLQRVIASKVQRVKQVEDGCLCAAESSNGPREVTESCAAKAHYQEI